MSRHPFNQKALDAIDNSQRGFRGGTSDPMAAAMHQDDDDEFEVIFNEIFDDDSNSSPSKIEAKVWSGVIHASYVGMSTIERVTRWAIDIVAMDEAGALQVVRNLYNSDLVKDYPTLDSTAVKLIRDFKPGADKDLIPHLIPPQPFGGFWSASNLGRKTIV